MTDLNAAFAAAVAVHHTGDLAAAERMYRDVLKQFPAHAASLCNLGVILVRGGKLDEAADCYKLALAHTPNYPDAHFNLGNLFRRSNRLAEAADSYRHCLDANPHHAAAAYNLGLVFVAVNELSEAADCFRKVVRLEPANAEAHGRLGDTLLRSGQLAEGVAAFRKGVELAPKDPRGYYNLGLALSNSGKAAEAHEHIQKSLKLRPDYAEAHNALGLNLEAQGRKDDALFHYQESVRLKPDLADGWSNLGTNLSEQGRMEEAINCLRESLSLRPNAPPIHSNLLLLLNYSPRFAPEQVFAEHLAWAEKFAGPTPDRPAVAAPHDPDRRLRVGYISGDFRQHTVAGFIRTLLTHHDRRQVEAFAYANVLRQDDVTDELRKLADKWRPVGGLPDERVADQVRDDAIDVLIDLSGHTAGNRMQVLAARPAPVQATLFGYPNTTGLKAVDYRITDAVSDPPGQTEKYAAEALLRLPEVAWVYAPPANAPAVTPLPAAGKRWFTFGCLNNPAKVSDTCLDLWCELLQKTPGTRLVVLAGQSQAGAKRLTDRFVKAGILRDRLEFVSRLPKDQYFAKYLEFDLALDPFPYNGGVTSGDSLWMGVPLLSIAGPVYASRQGAMLMTALGLPEFVAQSPADLLRLAKAWTTKRPELATVRAGLRDRMVTSPVTDAPRYVKHLEDAIRKAWRERLPA